MPINPDQVASDGAGAGPGAGALHPAFVAATSWSRAGAAAAADLAIMAAVACVSALGGFVTLMVAFQTDFDGFPGDEAMREWMFYTLGAAGALLYGSVEEFGRSTPGKSMLGLSLVALDPGRARRSYARRCLVKLSPILTFAAVSSAGAAYASSLDPSGFDDFGWVAGWDVVIAFALPAAVVVAGFCHGFATGNHQTPYDRASGVVVARRSYLTAPRGRAFPVILTAAPAPALLVDAPPGEYPPSVAAIDPAEAAAQGAAAAAAPIGIRCGPENET